MRILIAFISGLLFGVGLTLSDMINPARVLAFLDISSGAWDPTLAFVMAGALVPMAIAWQIAGRRQTSGTGPDLPRPASGIDRSLIRGAALFGAGWGLVGFCPGPAVSALIPAGWPAALFVVAMIAGMALAQIWSAPSPRPA